MSSKSNTDLESNKPMMSDEEIRIIDALLDSHRPKYCLEWGSGNSTKYFANHDYIDQWLSIEHNGHFLDYIRDDCPANVQTLWVLPGSSYADVVQRSNRKFDFILVDGLDRPKCLINAMDIINPGGVILLHDAGRIEFDELIEKYDGERLTEGEIPNNQGGYAHRGLAVFWR